MKLSKELLIDEYLNKGKPMHQIAEENNVAVGTVYNYIKKYGIQSRKRMSEETKRKISESLKDKPFKPRGAMSEDTKRKISEARQGKFKLSSRFGGHTKKRDGYIAVYIPSHPSANKDGYVMEHVLVMENHIGRHLTDGEVVHHKNKTKDDNRIENLQLMTKQEHARFHMIERHRERRNDLLTR